MDFSASERAHYDELEEETEETSVEHEGEGFLLSKIQRLQMACNHPSLQDSRAVAAELCQLSSSKLEYVRHLAQETAQQGEQMLVFSFWTATLDLLEPLLESQDIPFCRWQTCFLPLTCLHTCLFICSSPIMITTAYCIRGPLPDTSSSQSNHFVPDVLPTVHPVMERW